MMSKVGILRLAIAMTLFLSSAAHADADFNFAVLRYDGQGYNARPTALKHLSWEVMRRTSVVSELATEPVPIASTRIFSYPFLSMHGDRQFAPLSDAAIRNLSRHLRNGGILWIDNNQATIDGAFDRSVRRMLKRIFPSQNMRTIPNEHVLFKTFYLVNRFAGRVLVRPYAEGIMLGSRIAVLYTMNDIAGAYERDEFGNWVFHVSGGQRQREMALRFGINVVMYALCLDYKSDQVHIPFILKRRH